MALDYFALLMLIIVLTLVIYGIIAVYSIPYEIATARSHPHREAIAATTWVTLLTLDVL